MYSTDGGAAFTVIKGRITAAEANTFAAGRLDEAQGHWQLRVSKDVVPDPNKDHRIQCAPILGADTYRPTGRDPISDGRYWLVDLQKV
jgi:hypothetical protein